MWTDIRISINALDVAIPKVKRAAGNSGSPLLQRSRSEANCDRLRILHALRRHRNGAPEDELHSLLMYDRRVVCRSKR